MSAAPGGLWDSGDTRMRIGIVKLAGTVDDAGEFVPLLPGKTADIYG